MFKFLSLISILILNLNASDIYDSSYWKLLLHLDASGKSKVIAPDFLLSKDEPFSPEEELHVTVERLRADDGMQTACRFPARYRWLKQQLPLPEYDLSQCEALQSFVDTFEYDRMSIVFSAEYPNSPSSAFGHVMFIFHAPEQEIELADTVHFAAHIPDGDGGIAYALRGITGKYPAYYMREPFFKKLYEYNILEQRAIHIYELDYSKAEIQYLIYHLYELRNSYTPYYFLNQNCATEMLDLISVIEERDIPGRSYLLPIEVIKHYRDRIVKTTSYQPLLYRIDYLTHRMNEKEKALFYRIIQTNESPEAGTPDIVKEALADYYLFSFRKLHRVYKNYDDVMKQTFTPTPVPVEVKDPLSNPPVNKIGIGAGGKSARLHYRPLFTDFTDRSANAMQESKLNILYTEFVQRDDTLLLERLDLVDVESRLKQFEFFRPVSWSVYSGINRENHAYETRFDNEIGMGASFKLDGYTSLSAMLKTGISLSNETAELYLKPDLELNLRLPYLQAGAKGIYKQNFKHEYLESNLFIAKSIRDYRLSLNYKASNNSDIDELYLSLDYAF